MVAFFGHPPEGCWGFGEGPLGEGSLGLFWEGTSRGSSGAFWGVLGGTCGVLGPFWGGALGGQPPGLLRPSSQRRSHGPASHGAATLLSAMGRVSSVYTLEVESWALTHVLLWQKAAVVRL